MCLVRFLYWYIFFSLNRAISAWYESRDWFNSLCRLVMEQDWSWNRPALDYLELYHAARKWKNPHINQVNRGFLWCHRIICTGLQDLFLEHLRFWFNNSSHKRIIFTKTPLLIIFSCFFCTKTMVVNIRYNLVTAFI